MMREIHMRVHLSSASNEQQHWSGTALVISLNMDTQKLHSWNNTSTASLSRSVGKFIVDSSSTSLLLDL